MVIAEISVIPVGTGTSSVSKYVARALGIMNGETGIKYQLTAMGTIVEGELDKILVMLKKMHESAFDDKVKRVVTTLKIDDRRDKEATINYKVESVIKKLERKN